jgi:hypothetical protein
MLIHRIIPNLKVDDAAAGHAFHPLTDEPWGVRRFFVRNPHGHVVNVVSRPS